MQCQAISLAEGTVMHSEKLITLADKLHAADPTTISAIVGA